MKHTNVMVAELMDRSISHTEIVHAPYSAVLAADLADACGGSAPDAESAEFWGSWEDEDGASHEWRIHLTRPSSKRG